MISRLRIVPMVVFSFALMAAHSHAQGPPAPEPPKPPKAGLPREPKEPPPAPAPEAPPRREPGQLANVRIDVTITDQKGPAKPLTKTLTLTLADRENGMVRSEGETPVAAGMGEMHKVPLHVDAFPAIEGDKIRLRLSLNYSFVDNPTAESPRVPKTEVRETLSVVLDNGKPMVVAQSADPITDRHITLEVKATILR